ncbi:MAG: hypothetical protein HY678_03965 [Chloroflexi bacterium]|nr:hypothetical protein [Chloroflexota bacterium]
MDLTFERGDPDRPRGHAIVYVRDAADPNVVSATYLVILPVSMDIAKYVPPFLAQQVPKLGEQGLTAFAFPPAPERVDSHDQIVKLAEYRGDDLIFAGSRPLTDPGLLLAVIGEVVSEYSARYERLSKPAAAEQIEPGRGVVEVSDVLYGLMSEADKLNELTKLVGRLRYAREGSDTATADESEAHIKVIGSHLPENRQVDRILAAATSSSRDASKLAQLYLERAYCLYREDYMRVKALEAEIAQLELDKG